MPKVAHFLQNPGLLGSPPNEAMVAAYQTLGYEVDVYSTWTASVDDAHKPGVTLKKADYSNRWICRNLGCASWREYAAFSSTTEDPSAVAGLLSWLWRRPLVTLADEIRNGSYAGNRNERWKALCRWGMRRSALTVVNEKERIALQKQYANYPSDARFLVYPGCFRFTPVTGERGWLRAERGIPENVLVLCYSGLLSHANGGVWIAHALKQCPTLWVWAQTPNIDPLTRGLLECLDGSERLVIENQRMDWVECWSSMAAADVGMVIYLQDAPQYQHMGTASNRLCMFLAMGVPVIAKRQPSFEFVEQFDCGVLVDSSCEIGRALEKIAPRLDSMRGNAIRCCREYINAKGRWNELCEAFTKFLPKT